MNMEDVLADLGIETNDAHHHATSGFFQTDCCWCSPGTGTYRLGIARNGSCCVCWVCGKHRTGDTLARITGRHIGEILKLLRGIDRGPIKIEEKPRGKLVLPRGLGPLQRCHERYLKGKRKLDPDMCVKLWGLQGVGIDSARYRWRLFIPVTLHGETVSFTTRAITDTDKYKYLAASPEEEAIDHRTVGIGFEYVRNTVVVLEGPMDVMTLGPGAVCGFGVNLSGTLIRKIAQTPTRVVIGDADAAGNRWAEGLCDSLECFPGCTYRVKLTSGKDLNSAEDAEVRSIRKRFLR